jgi:hypothetical protein
MLALAAGNGIVVESAHAAVPSTGSEVTVKASDYDADSANAPFPKLAVTVSQTEDLQAQGIQVSWTGGKRSVVPSSGGGGENFLQIMQCWGDDPTSPHKPDRTTCQYGGYLTAGATRDNYRSEGSVNPADEKYTAPSASPLIPTYTSIPFRSATGVTVASVVDNKRVDVDVNTNQFFTRLTTNEVSWAGSTGDGIGSAKFEVQTASQSPGLGCGAPVTTAGTVTGQSCWLVIIPRGTDDVGETSINTSGLFWDTWKHHVAVKLSFKPLGSRCTIGAAERQLAGSELASIAVNSWQPTLCRQDKGAVYTVIKLPEPDALSAANGTVAQPLALTSRPLNTDSDVRDHLQYAPIALTGLAVTFAIDRAPSTGPTVPQAEKDKDRLPLESLKLTPRLVAKLLTNSYLDSLPVYADKTHVNYTSAEDPGHNATNLTRDPDFLAVNDKAWSYQAFSSASLADLLTPQGRSDGAWALWTYVLSDQDAVDFLAGKPDPWGMIVNPWIATDPEVNKLGVGFDLPTDTFPKADPIELPGTPGGAGPVNLVTWRPYTIDYDTSAYLTLRGDGQLLGAWDFNSIPPKWGKEPRRIVGLQSVLGLSDTASAGKYQVVTASLRNPAGAFVAPTTESLTAAAAAMTPSATQSQVLSFDPKSSNAKAATNAYPLAMPVYAATNPAQPDAALRRDYATFITYAVTDGQVPGTDFGELPVGYAPIPEAWKTQALAAATAIATGPVPAPGTNLQTLPQQPTPSSTTSTAQTGTTVSAPQTTANPEATGEISGKLAGAITPDDPNAGALGAVVPVAFLVIIAVAILARFLSRRRRVL